MAAQQLVELAWEWLAQDIGIGLASSPSRRDQKLKDLGRPLASVMTAGAAIGAASTLDAVSSYAREQGDAVTTLEMSALRAAAKVSWRGDAGLGDLTAACAARLRTRLARPQRAPSEWSVELPVGTCACELCENLRTFLADKNQRSVGPRHWQTKIGAPSNGR